MRWRRGQFDADSGGTYTDAGDAYADAHTYADAGTHADADTYADTYSNAYADAYAYAYADTNPDAHSADGYERRSARDAGEREFRQ